MFPRKITSLQEDMQRLGLSKLVNPDINRDTRSSPTGHRPARQAVTESRAPMTPRQKERLAEQRKALVERKKHAKVQRESRMTKKAAIFETRLQRIERAAKAKSLKVEAKIRAIKNLDKRIAALESYDLVKALGGKQPTAKQLGESFFKVASLAGTLARTFAVLESFVGEAESNMGIPVMHTMSAYGYDKNVNNVADGSVPPNGGVVTDYTSNVKQKDEDDETEPKDDVAEDDDDAMTMGTPPKKDDDDKTDDVTEDDDDMKSKDDMSEDDDCKDKDDVTEDDDEMDDKKDDMKAEDEEPAVDDADDKAAKKMESRRRAHAESIAQRLPMDFELHSIRMEAEEMGVKAMDGQAQNVNMGYATDLMNDMVSYLGGAMKLYFKIQNSMQNMGYVGQDQPVGVGAEVPATQVKNDAYVGAGQPAGGTAVDQGGAANAPKVGDATDTTNVKEPKAESKK